MFLSFLMRNPFFSVPLASVIGSGLSLSLRASTLAEYTFDEGSDGSPNSRVVDQSGNNFRGTLYSGAEYVPAGDGFALRLIGGSSWVKCLPPSAAVPFETHDFSVEFSVKLNRLAAGMVMGRKTDEPNAKGWIIEFGEDGMEMIFSFSDGRSTEVLAVPIASPETWHHVVMVRQGENVTIYVDGREVEVKSSPVFGGDLQSETRVFHIGKILGKFQSIDGQLDNVVIHGEALSSDVITQHYQQSRGQIPASEGEGAHRRVESHSDVAIRPGRLRGMALAGLAAAALAGSPIHAADSDPSLVLHYRFDTKPDGIVKDLSGYGNDARVGDVKFLEEAEGRKGVLRFDGEHSWMDIGNPESLRFSGDLTLEMWVRMNRELSAGPNAYQSVIFGEYPHVGRLFFGWVFYHTLTARYANREAAGSMVLPIARDTIGEEWAHIAVVFEYPRCRFYKDGVLVRDAYMPLPGVEKLVGSKFIGGMPPGSFEDASPATGNFSPIDLTEFRMYKRALSPEEVAAHARNEKEFPSPAPELAVEPDWYKDIVTVRFVGKGGMFKGHQVKLILREGAREVASETINLQDQSLNDSQRFVGSVQFSLDGLNGKNVTVTAEAPGSGLNPVEKSVALKKPDWIGTSAGRLTGVPVPWTPVKTETKPDGDLQVSVWDRNYTFGEMPFPVQISAAGEDLLTGPIVLSAEVVGKAVSWQAGKRTEKSDPEGLKVEMEQELHGAGLEVKVGSVLEYDGYLFFDCEVKAREDVTLDRLDVSIPLKSAHANLCAASYVLPKDTKVSMSESYWDEIRGNLDFLFAPSIWVGDDTRGLTWQAETNEFWRNTDPRKAVQIQPSGDTTVFRTNFLDKPTTLKSGETLRYQFALLATPVKQMLRDSWDLRVMRGGPYGNELQLPDMTINGQPQLEYLSDIGVRGMMYMTADLWPWPMPIHKAYSDAVHRLNKVADENGIKTMQYMIHTRYPVLTEEFDIYGINMVQTPMKPFNQKGNLPPVKNNPRQGPITVDLGADSQGAMMFCPKSPAVQDAWMHSLNKRVRTYDDDGVYLDGSGQVMPCTNTEHGCGYVGEDGTVHPTYPTFAARDFSRRIYNTIKDFKPDGIVDLHYWHPNPAQAAYADLLFTGEQWHQLRKTGTDYVAGELTLPRFRSMFMGYQVGTPVDLLSYRLGRTGPVAATSLLHDVPVRLNQGSRDIAILADPPPGTAQASLQDAEYFRLLPRLWKLRDAFEINEAERLYYWKNKDFVTVSPEGCYTTIFNHPENGVLAFVSNLTRTEQDVEVALNLDKLKQTGKDFEAVDALSGEPVSFDKGSVHLRLGSEEWKYVLLKPRDTRVKTPDPTR